RRQRREPELEATCLALHPLEHLTETKPQARLLPRHTQQLRIGPLDRLEPLGRIPCAPHAHKLANDGSNVDFKNTRSSFFRAAWCDQCRDSRALATRRWALARVPITRASTPPRASAGRHEPPSVSGSRMRSGGCGGAGFGLIAGPRPCPATPPASAAP